MQQPAELTENERLLAAAAHASVVLGVFTNGVAGIAAALVIWLVQREKSAYVAFQALQAVVYQIVGTVITLALWACWGLTLPLATLCPVLINPTAYQDRPPITFFGAFGLLCIPLAVTAVWILYGLYGALRAYSGADFSYVLIGRMLKR